ncbi:MAG: FMN-binding negative transcriptional regulator [Chitinophagaceae bacterium]
MYNLPYFKANNPGDVVDFMHAHPFVMLIVNGNEYPVATQVPVLFKEREGKMILRAHVMRKTDHHLALEEDANVLVVFSSAHTYVSASWYTDPKSGSTWNYRSVHAKGKLRFTTADELLQLLTDLTDTFENNPDSPSLVKHLPEEYMQTLMKAIVGIEIEVEDIQHVFKLSQNRNKESFQNIITQLDKGSPDARAVAEEMKKNVEL